MQGKRREPHSTTVENGRAEFQYTANRQLALAQPYPQEEDPHTQPSEPILFPKLRIYFADFPYLLYSIDQRLLTLET